MALRIRVRSLVDVLLVRDPAQMAALNQHRDVSRDLSPAGGWLNALVRARTAGTFRVGDTPLGVFAGRDAPGRAARRDRLEERLKGTVPAPADVAQLARYVAGARLSTPVGVLAQGTVGRLFFPDYVASDESHRAATTLASVNPLRMLWAAVTGARERSQALLWQLGREDVDCIHAATLAVHGVTETLRRMRRLFADPRWRDRDEGAALRACLVPPAVLLRSSTAPTQGGVLGRPLAQGTLVVFRLGAMFRARRDTDLAFTRGEWSRCPAHEVVPRLLETVWREAQRIPPSGARRRSLLSRAFTGSFALVNRRRPWHRLPTPIALANLLALRITLREENLHDTETDGTRRCPVTGWLPRYRHARSADGRFNDLTQPTMGATGTRFGRLVPLGHTVPDAKALLTPNPRTISHRLLARRHGFIPATSLNLLAAAWIQFQAHDWFSHGEPDTEQAWPIPLEPGDGWPEPPMRIGRTPPQPRDPGVPAPTYANKVTHWWDASQVYGSDETEQRRVREYRGGRLAVTPTGQLPVDAATGIAVTGFADNWWVGLGLMHTLFALEHNAICDRLRAEQPGWDDEQLFGTARLVNAALIAKIHTLEWTPALLGHPAVVIGMRGNWWGLAGERLHRLLGRLSDSEVVSGIPGSPADHHGTSFSIPEEFVSVYRMHPLLPDELVFRSAATGEELERRSLLRTTGADAHRVLSSVGMGDLFYSFGVAHPGALTLGNYPETLRSFRRLNGTLVDVAAADVLRDRERGVPRYNAFRRLLGMRSIASFEELNRSWARELREVYGDVERLDLMVGMFAETPPRGFAFSDTAFRVFILMASRRLRSDRFFTTDYRPEVYTRAGIEWVENNDMKSVLTRHYPELRPILAGAGNPFAPWARVG